MSDCEHGDCDGDYCTDILRLIRRWRLNRQVAARRLGPLSSGHRDPWAWRTDAPEVPHE